METTAAAAKPKPKPKLVMRNQELADRIYYSWAMLCGMTVALFLWIVFVLVYYQEPWADALTLIPIALLGLGPLIYGGTGLRDFYIETYAMAPAAAADDNEP